MGWATHTGAGFGERWTGSETSFLALTGASVGAAFFDPFGSALDALLTIRQPAAAPLDILVLGGTGFIGPHLVRHAVSRGHRVTIFTRGRRQADLPESVIRLIGDRNGQLGALEGWQPLSEADLETVLIGVIEAMWSAYFSTEYKDVAAFGILVLVLIFRPTGLLGRPEIEKV